MKSLRELQRDADYRERDIQRQLERVTLAVRQYAYLPSPEAHHVIVEANWLAGHLMNSTRPHGNTNTRSSIRFIT